MSGPNGASGRFYNAFRWYRPQWGRYTQIDPLEYVGGSYNLYGYVSENPQNFVDPSATTGLGLYVGAAGEAGMGPGVGGSTSVGVGVFTNGSNLTGGGFLTSCAFSGFNGQGFEFPNTGGFSGAVGASAAFNGGLFITNASNVQQLKGPFQTINFSVDAFGGISLQYAFSGNIGVFSFGPSAGLGLGGSAFPTTTVTSPTVPLFPPEGQEGQGPYSCS
ncbi:MAG: hypothetical protein GIW96_06945 [Candidatus Eremiobacteraeota bacterium]|nr:hypothetical protein [Candidatus Eremiobacteraeota bacterium]